MLNGIGDILGLLFYHSVVTLFGYIIVRMCEGVYSDTPQEIRPLDTIDKAIMDAERSFDKSFLFWYPGWWYHD